MPSYPSSSSFRRLCTRIRQRLQQTRFAFLLPPKARAKGRFLSVSRQAEWGLQTLAYLEAKEREHSPEASALAQALRGLKSFKLFLMTFVRNTTCLNEVMKIVKTQGLSAESIQACQETAQAIYRPGHPFAKRSATICSTICPSWSRVTAPCWAQVM